jgi:hypothetical protein
VRLGLSLAVATLSGLTWLAPPAAAGDVSLTIANGRISIVAHDATPRQILEAWARQGHTRIVNVERVSGGPDTLVLTNEPEAKALAVLLRSVAGYIAAPRRVPMADASQYDRILIMPTSYATPPPAYRADAPQPMRPPAIFEPPPDPTALANDDNPAPGPPVFQPTDAGNGPVPVPQPATPPVNPLTPDLPPAETSGDQPQTPPVQPAAGQLTTPTPGVLPVPPQTPQQQPR